MIKLHAIQIIGLKYCAGNMNLVSCERTNILINLSYESMPTGLHINAPWNHFYLRYIPQKTFYKHLYSKYLNRFGNNFKQAIIIETVAAAQYLSLEIRQQFSHFKHFGNSGLFQLRKSHDPEKSRHISSAAYYTNVDSNGTANWATEA